MNKIKLIIPLILVLLFSSCSKDTVTQNTLKSSNIDKIEKNSMSNNGNTQKNLGLQLKLFDVSKEYEGIFNTNFDIVKEGFNDLIYRQSQDIKNLSQTFQIDRPDLNNAKMTYDATNNMIDFVYYYTPTPDDIDISSDPNSMTVKLASYNYIGKAISYYLDACRKDLRQKNIELKQPQIYITYLVNDDYYLTTYMLNQFRILFGVKLPQKELVQIEGQFASAILKAVVANPQKTIGGKTSPEYSLINFFKIDANATDAKNIKNSNEATVLNKDNNETNYTTYENREYKFTINIPKLWEGKYSVKEGKWAPEAEKTIDFSYMKNSKNYGNIFSILIIKGTITKSQWDNPMWKFIDTKNGRTFAYTIAGEPSKELLDGNHETELHEQGIMIDEDLPKIIQTFTFN